MHSKADGKPESADPEEVVRMLELELMQQRLARQHAGPRYAGFRVASFVFLFAVILGATLAFLFVFSSGRVDELRAQKAITQPSPSVTPRAPTP